MNIFFARLVASAIHAVRETIQRERERERERGGGSEGRFTASDSLAQEDGSSSQHGCHSWKISFRDKKMISAW